jgi:methionyl-tRNA synthetase
MVGRQVPVITNLAPRKLKGIESSGMIIYAIDESTVDGAPAHKTIMLNPEKIVPPGSPVQ